MYDFGDYWEHEILVEKILPLEKGTHYPVCVTGKRACPPEDCGGATGYEELLEILRTRPTLNTWTSSTGCRGILTRRSST